MPNLKGVHRANPTPSPAHNRAPVGAVSVRTFSRSKDQRAFVKVTDPNVWRLRAHVVWESAHGAIPAGACVHHKDRNKLNDDIENLELMSVAEHLREHRGEFADQCAAALVKARRERRWSTRSTTKRTGRPPTWTDAAMSGALADVREGAGVAEAARRHGVPVGTLYRHVAR